jgi:hypothetical protein
METTIRLPFQVNDEAFYLKENQLKSGKIWRIDAEVTECRSNRKRNQI